ncbi:MAG: PilZ domain-containing protein [Deltaproteobacteria bacterium]|nr:PilZ domain-containing protein [Deltaproteobacteria bacterium]
MLFSPRAERSAVRFGVHVDCQVVRERDFRVIGRGSLDLSLNGVLVQCTLDADIGDEVIVSFRTPRRQEWVDAVGMVTRLIAGRRQGDLGLAAGITFTSLDEASFRALARALYRAPPTRHGRPTRIDYAATVRTIAEGGSPSFVL